MRLYSAVGCVPSRASWPDSELCDDVQRPLGRRLLWHLWSYTSSLTPPNQPTSPPVPALLWFCVWLWRINWCVRVCVCVRENMSFSEKSMCVWCVHEHKSVHLSTLHLLSLSFVFFIFRCCYLRLFSILSLSKQYDVIWLCKLWDKNSLSTKFELY